MILMGALLGGLAAAIAVGGIPRSYSGIARLGLTPEFDVTQYVDSRDLGVTPDATRYGTVGQLGEIGITRAALLDRLGRSARVDLSFDRPMTQLLITGRARDPRAAAQLANAFAIQIVAQREALVRARRIQAKENRMLLVRLAPGGLQARAAGNLYQRLKLLESVPGIGVQFEEPASPSHEPASPHRRRDILAGTFLGALLAPWGVALARALRIDSARRA